MYAVLKARIETGMISAGYQFTIGLKSDGTCIAIGDNSNTQCNVSGWTNIKQISAGQYHTVALKNDGTCVAINHNPYYTTQCNVNNWDLF